MAKANVCPSPWNGQSEPLDQEEIHANDSDHPNARNQRRHVDEKGPFGRATRRRATSRTRTATPAKKDNLTLDGFEEAMSFDLNHSQPATPAQRETPRPSTSTTKQPTQVVIYGYSAETQWAALDAFERASYGYFCEDYPRTPPEAGKRLSEAFSTPPRGRRSLSKMEKALALRYAGGQHWVKVTFDSTEAAERALEHSPAQIYGHWVHAGIYHGAGPARDEALPIIEGSTESPQATSLVDSSHPATDRSSEVRQRILAQESGMMTHFPTVPRTVLRPSTEAFLPQLTWWERQMKWLAEAGLVPGEVIGNGIPLKVDGCPDVSRASFYWKFFYWIDSLLGTDICGLKDD